MNEFALIAELRRIFDGAGIAGRFAEDGIVIPNGDDAAVVRVAGGLATITTDALVDGVHFSFDICSPADAGYRSIAVNLSDLAAMAARPVGLLVSLVVPDSMEDTFLCKIAEGIAVASAQFHVPVVGGNITRTPGPLVISITAVGEQVVMPVPCRNMAVAGDEIWVSGFVGDGALGLRLLLENRSMELDFPRLVASFRRPLPRLDLTDIIGRADVHAVIDISDGFVADLEHISADSGVMANVDINLIPISDEARAFCLAAGRTDLMPAALYGGDDYQLILVAPASSHVLMVEAGLHCVGSISAGQGVALFSNGLRVQTESDTGWLHRR